MQYFVLTQCTELTSSQSLCNLQYLIDSSMQIRIGTFLELFLPDEGDHSIIETLQ